MSTIRAFAVLLALSLAGPVSDAVAQGACVSDIRQLPGEARALTLPAALQRAGVSGQVVDAQLCQSGGGYVYRVRIRAANGELKSMQIPAN